MSVREVLTCIQSIQPQIVGTDIVDYNPTRDRHAQQPWSRPKRLMRWEDRRDVQVPRVEADRTVHTKVHIERQISMDDCRHQGT